MNKTIVIIILFIMVFAAHAENFYSQHEKGWFWFDDPKDEIKKEKPNNADNSVDPSEMVQAAQKKLKSALDKAVLYPTQQNVEAYIVLQNQMSLLANQFANTWQQVVRENSDLNYSITHPTNNLGIQVFNQTESQKKLAAIKKFSEQAGLFFFYKSTCPYCQRFAPIVKHFADTYHIAIVPITTDGISLPEFPNSRQDSGQSRQFNVTVEPSLYAVDPATQKAFPVAFGLTSESELFDNIYNIMTRYTEGL